jgi:glycerol-3-phosphate dehydrogenase
MFFRRKAELHRGSFSHRTRNTNLKRFQQEEFDLAIVGAGITGAAIARDAALRGMKVALLDKGDFASGTSSKSSKMIHGGLRYLKQLDIKLVKESLAEREKLLHLAPHLVHPASYLIPIYSGWMERLELHIGLHGYDLLASRSSLERHRNLSSKDVLRDEPLLRQDHLSGGFTYPDCLVNDARLTLATVKSAHEHEAVIANYTSATGIGSVAETMNRVDFQDVFSGTQGQIRARVIVVASGPWTDEFLELQDHPGPKLRPTKGVHLVFPRSRLQVNRVVVVPTEDKRMIFVVPLGNYSYVGTTDTDYSGSLDTVLVDAEDVSYLLDTINHSFPSLHLGPDDIVSTWAALRPLLSEEGAPSKVSRDYHVGLYDDGVAVITGGKLTTHRTMAESLIDQIIERFAGRFQESFQPCRTAEIPLVGGEMAEFPSYLQAQSIGLMTRWGLSQVTAEHLINSYGRNHMDILALGLDDRRLLEPLSRDCRAIKAQVIYAVEDEMALTLEDFMGRRTDLLHFNGDDGVPQVVTKLMAKRLGWTRARRRVELQRYRAAVEQMFHFRKNL